MVRLWDDTISSGREPHIHTPVTTCALLTHCWGHGCNGVRCLPTGALGLQKDPLDVSVRPHATPAVITVASAPHNLCFVCVRRRPKSNRFWEIHHRRPTLQSPLAVCSGGIRPCCNPYFDGPSNEIGVGPYISTITVYHEARIVDIVLSIVGTCTISRYM